MEEIDRAIGAWTAARSIDEVLDAMTRAKVPAGRIYSAKDIAEDPHYASRGAIISVEGTPMQGLIAKLSGTPGAVRWRGRARDADGDDIRENGWG